MTRFTLKAAVLAAFVLAGPNTARAGYVLVTSRAALGGTDSIDWGQLGPSFTVVPAPANVTSGGGVTATVSKFAGNFERRDQGNGWDGNFAAGDKLLWTQGADGPIFVNFNGAALTAAGAQIQNQPYGPFTATISVRDGMGNPLASFNVPGNSTDSANPPAIFVGILATGGDTFARVTFSTPSASTAINQLDFSLAPAAVPAPAGLVLILAAAPALALRRAVRRRA